MPLQDFSAKAQKMIDLVETVAEKISYETEFVQRNSKMTGSLFAKTLLTGWLKHSQASLEMLCKRAADLGVAISPRKRFKPEAVDYFRQLFAYCLQAFQSKQGLEIAVLQQFKGIYLTDSTQITLPKALAHTWRGSGGLAAPAALKMHLQFDFLRGQVSAVQFTAGSSADSTQSIAVEAGSLALLDLGYFVIDRFKQPSVAVRDV
jgi:Transposase DDE domain